MLIPTTYESRLQPNLAVRYKYGRLHVYLLISTTRIACETAKDAKDDADSCTPRRRYRWRLPSGRLPCLLKAFPCKRLSRSEQWTTQRKRDTPFRWPSTQRSGSRAYGLGIANSKVSAFTAAGPGLSGGRILFAQSRTVRHGEHDYVDHSD